MSTAHCTSHASHTERTRAHEHLPVFIESGSSETRYTNLFACISEEDDSYTVQVRLYNHGMPENTAWGEEMADSLETASMLVSALAAEFSIAQAGIKIEIRMQIRAAARVISGPPRTAFRHPPECLETNTTIAYVCVLELNKLNASRVYGTPSNGFWLALLSSQTAQIARGVPRLIPQGRPWRIAQWPRDADNKKAFFFDQLSRLPA